MTEPLKIRKKPTKPIDNEPFMFLGSRAEEHTPEYKAGAKLVMTADDLVKFLKIDTWDYLLIGDGSGSNWAHPGGYASAMVSRDPRGLQWFYGSVSNATNITCEMKAYIEPLLWLLGREKELKHRIIHIATDCEHLVWSSEHPGSWKANKLLWQLLANTARFGIELHWHWIPRNCVSFNKMADALAGLSRLTNVALQDEVKTMTAKYLEPKSLRAKAKKKKKRKPTAADLKRKEQQKDRRRDARAAKREAADDPLPVPDLLVQE